MMPADLERRTQKLLKLISVDGTAVLCNFRSMSIVKWNSWRREGNQDVETFFGFQVTQDYACLIRVCETLLLRMKLGQYHTKRQLSAILIELMMN